ncbi:hypothetical protein GCM10027060_22410 [Nesterenkonia halophila]|uniref:hypothetical protein n=1 Tax=Nesterenkonia halophila TaxID=302044 RepID=UPI0012918CD3|nr:hypothetical protein [Nesterenkonia halophila]
MKHLPVALSGLLSAAALLASSFAGASVLAAVVCLMCLVVSLGWPQLMGVAARRSLVAVILGAGVVAALGAAVVSAVESLFFWSSVALAFGVMAIFVIQVVRGTGRPHRIESTIGASSGVVVTTTAAGWVAGLRYPAELVGVGGDRAGLVLIRSPLPYEDWGVLGVTGASGELTVVGLAALALCVAVLLACLPLRDLLAVPLIILGTAAAALGVGLAWGELTALFSVVLGLAAGLLVSAMRRLLLHRGAPAGRMAAFAVGTAPVAVMGALVFFAERLLLV